MPAIGSRFTTQSTGAASRLTSNSRSRLQRRMKTRRTTRISAPSNVRPQHRASLKLATHRWIDLTDKSGAYGVTVLTDFKNGSDKPDANTIRVTLLRSPGIQPRANRAPGAYSDQANQDWGHHDITIGLAGHAGDWREAQTDWQGYRLNDPMMPFTATRHPGELGKSLSLMHIDNSRIRVFALKRAEASDEIVLRMAEMDGKPEPNVHISFSSPLIAAREVNAQEQPLGAAEINDGALVTSFGPYQPRTFALRLSPITGSRRADRIEAAAPRLHARSSDQRRHADQRRRDGWPRQRAPRRDAPAPNQLRRRALRTRACSNRFTQRHRGRWTNHRPTTRPLQPHLYPRRIRRRRSARHLPRRPARKQSRRRELGRLHRPVGHPRLEG